VLPTGDLVEPIVIARVDPTILRIRVHYDPSEPKTVSAWEETLHPVLIVNGAYFMPDNRTTGLLVSDGVEYGSPYGTFAGMLAVTTDGDTRLRWLSEQPYDPDEPIAQALQSFPMLVKPGGTLGFPANADDGRPARRTAVAQDLQGNILFIVAPRGTLSLHALSRFLAESDLEIRIAVNLDGGTSSGLSLRTEALSLDIDSLVPVPSAISVQE